MNDKDAAAAKLSEVHAKATRWTVIDYWHDFGDGLQIAPLEFYELVQTELEARRLPRLQILSVTHREGGFGSAERLYLRIKRHWGYFDICAAPFGTGSFFSYRYLVPKPYGMLVKLIGLVVVVNEGTALLVPILGVKQALAAGTLSMIVALVAFFGLRRDTYFRQDSGLMYLATVSAVVKSVYERVTLRHGARLAGRLSATDVATP